MASPGISYCSMGFFPLDSSPLPRKHKYCRKRTLIQLTRTFLPEWYFNILIKSLIVFGTESASSFPGYYNIVQHAHECHTTPLLHTHSMSWSRAIRFVLQVPWHKPASQEANHIKSVSHVTAYTGSEALRGVIFDIVLHPHTVTCIPLPQLCFWEILTPNLCT